MRPLSISGSPMSIEFTPNIIVLSFLAVITSTVRPSRLPVEESTTVNSIGISGSSVVLLSYGTTAVLRISIYKIPPLSILK